MNVGHIISYKRGFGGRIIDAKLGSLFFSQNSMVSDIEDADLLADLHRRGAQGQAVQYLVGQRPSELEVCGIKGEKNLEDLIVDPRSGVLINS